jgi:hypothetical protein
MDSSYGLNFVKMLEGRGERFSPDRNIAIEQVAFDRTQFAGKVTGTKRLTGFLTEGEARDTIVETIAYLRHRAIMRARYPLAVPKKFAAQAAHDALDWHDLRQSKTPTMYLMVTYDQGIPVFARDAWLRPRAEDGAIAWVDMPESGRNVFFPRDDEATWRERQIARAEALEAGTVANAPTLRRREEAIVLMTFEFQQGIRVIPEPEIQRSSGLGLSR